MKILIYSFDYNWRVGGIVVLNKLAQVLAEQGHDIYILCGEAKSSSKAKAIDMKEALEIAKDNNTVVIYPEVIFGNPLMAKKVGRWILYFPGVNGGDKTFDESEYIFTYNTEFVMDTEFAAATEIQIVETMVDNFFDLGLERTKDVILVKKGNKNLRSRRRTYLKPMEKMLYKPESADKIITESSNVTDYNLQLNKIRYFISYDNHSYHSVLASLAGCVSVIIPASSNLEKNPKSKFLAKIDSVSYGFRENNFPPDSQKLRSELKNMELDNSLAAQKLVKELDRYFFVA